MFSNMFSSCSLEISTFSSKARSWPWKKPGLQGDSIGLWDEFFLPWKKIEDVGKTIAALISKAKMEVWCLFDITGILWAYLLKKLIFFCKFYNWLTMYTTQAETALTAQFWLNFNGVKRGYIDYVFSSFEHFIRS